MDAIGSDPGEDGHAGADWYSLSYEEEAWTGIQDFGAALPLRMPTIGPWEWENHEETGTVARCPIVELDEVNVSLKLTGNLIDRVVDPETDTGRIWAQVELHTFQGGLMNSSVALGLTSDSINKEITITYSFEESVKLWDGTAYKEDPRTYQEDVIGAPYIIIRIFDADPSRYYIETTNRSFQLGGSAGIQEALDSTLSPFIDDWALQEEFRRNHLLDATMIGINAKTDENYLDVYTRKITEYQEWVNRTAEEAKDWSLGSGKWVRLFFAIGSLIISTVSAYYTGGYSAYVGIVFAIDQIQSLFTCKSIFSVLVGAIVIPIVSGIKGWTQEQTDEAYERFNVWAILGQNTKLGEIVNSLWSTGLTLAIIYGPGWIKKLFGTSPKGVANVEKPWEAHGLTEEQYIKTLKGKAVTAKTLTTDELNYLAKHYKAIYPERYTAIYDSFKAEWSMVDLAGLSSLHAIDDMPMAFEQLAKAEFLADIFHTPSTLYRITYMFKQFMGGFISPTEWVELAYFMGTGYFGEGFAELEFKRGWIQQLWNWGDNLLFLPFEDETTMGMFKWMFWASTGDLTKGIK